jgi:hypothetical protein
MSRYHERRSMIYLDWNETVFDDAKQSIAETEARGSQVLNLGGSYSRGKEASV